MRLRFRVSCQEGFEEFSAVEARSLGAEVVGSGKGCLTLEGPFRLTYALNRFGRTMDRIMVEMATAKLDEDDVTDSLIAKCDLGLLGPVSGVTLDADEFITRLKSRWITQISSLLPRAFRSGRGVRVVRGRADAYLFLTVEGDSVTLYADTTGDSLNFREYRAYNHPSSIRPVLAASLVIMAKPDGGKLYDPFCGGGTILIEAASMAGRRPTHTRRAYRYRRFVDYDRSEEEKVLLAGTSLPGFDSFFGNDINAVHLKGCIKNLAAAGLGRVEVQLGDCTKTTLAQRADAVVTNPPYGVRGAKLNRMELLIPRFLANLPNTLKAGGRAVVVTSDSDQLRRGLAEKGFAVGTSKRTLHSHLWVEAVQFAIPQT